MTQRDEVFLRLRQFGQPVSPGTLARWMNRPRQYVYNGLLGLYSRDLVDRKPQPMHKNAYLYYPKQVQG